MSTTQVTVELSERLRMLSHQCSPGGARVSFPSKEKIMMQFGILLLLLLYNLQLSDLPLDIRVNNVHLFGLLSSLSASTNKVKVLVTSHGESIFTT